jgi:hypothetical protein
MTEPQSPRIRDGFARALVHAARSDSPRAGAKGRALARLDARERDATAALRWCRRHAPVLLHGVRMATSAALIAASIGWSVAAPGAQYDTSHVANCRTNDEWSPPASVCSDHSDRSGAAFISGSSAASSGSSSG